MLQVARAHGLSHKRFLISESKMLTGLIRNVDGNGFAYFWSLANLYEPKSNGINSIEVYVKTNCNTNQIMVLKENQYKQEMAEGSHQSIELKPQWLSLPSDSIQHWASERTCWWVELSTE